MSVILTNIKMPKNCRECSFVIGKGDYRYCPMVVDDDCRMRDVSRNFNERHYDCPLRSTDGLIEHIRKFSYPVCHGINNIEHGMTMSGIKEAIKGYCWEGLEDEDKHINGKENE